MEFELLVNTINDTHLRLQQNAIKAINQNLTIRNWLTGFYIVEFEQNGADRSVYGKQLLKNLSRSLKDKGWLNINERELRRFRTFYQVYPQLSQAFDSLAIRGTLSPESLILPIRGTLSPELEKLALSPEKIIQSLSFSHLAELIEIEDPLKRIFYEIETIKGTWTVRELQRQINTAYFERMGLSDNPAKMSELVQQNTAIQTPSGIIKSHFAFEFLGLSNKTNIEESDIEQAILDHLQHFLLEMGRGFCFEARQKRLLIGDEYFFVDLVMYHRSLKCHVIIELKAGKFDHSHLSQLNTYVNYFKKEIQEEGDNPPIGILMVIDQNEALVEYALAGMDNQLFVSKYLLKLPNKEKLTDFILNEIKQN